MYYDFLNERTRFNETPIAEGEIFGSLRKGQKVTISRNKRTGDRSWTNLIHEVVAVNAGSVQLRPIAGHSWTPRYLLLDRYEHEFYRVSEDFVTGEEPVESGDLIDKIINHEPRLLPPKTLVGPEPSLGKFMRLYYTHHLLEKEANMMIDLYVQKLKEEFNDRI